MMVKLNGKLALGLSGLLMMALAGCGEGGGETASQTAAPQPNLRFIGDTVQILTVPGMPTVAYGQTLKVPCNTGGLRIRYKYGNGGPVPAGAHKVTGKTAGGGGYTFSELPLGAGVARTSIISSGAVPLPNTPTEVRITLDTVAPFVLESNEGDNVFRARLFRSCP